MNRLIYLHGFRSSPQSFKAQWLKTRMAELGVGERFECPQLAASPRQAMADVLETLRPDAHDALVGSSLGGYYATWLAEKIGCRAALLNPAVRPADSLAAHLGVQPMYHSDEPFEFRPEYLDELRDLKVNTITEPQRYLLVAATGDELLDWHDMVAHYPGATQRVIQGSDHGLSDFADYGDSVIEFAGCWPAAAAGAR